MPKKSLTLNGFPGGLNRDASMHDIISDGRGKDEALGSHEMSLATPGSLNAYLDEKGKVITKFIKTLEKSDLTYSTPRGSQNLGGTNPYFSGEFKIDNCRLSSDDSGLGQSANGFGNPKRITLPNGVQFGDITSRKAYPGMRAFISADGDGEEAFKKGTYITEVVIGSTTDYVVMSNKVNENFGTWITEDENGGNILEVYQEVDVVFRYNDPTSEQILIHKGEQRYNRNTERLEEPGETIYRNDGLYSLGNDVNWSGNWDYIAQTPNSGTISKGFDSNFNNASSGTGKKIKCTPDRTGDVILFISKNALCGYNKGYVMKDADVNAPTNSYLNPDFAPRDLVRVHTDGDTDGQAGDNDTTYWNDLKTITANTIHPADNIEGEAYINNNPIKGVIDDGSAIIGSNASNRISFSGSSVPASGSETDVSELDYFTFWRETGSRTGGYSEYVYILVFRVGRVNETTDPDWHSGSYGDAAPDIADMDIAIELKLMNTTNLRGVVVFAKAAGQDMRYDYNDTNGASDGASWFISASEMVAAGADADYKRFIIPKETTHLPTGADYSDGDVRTIGICPVWDKEAGVIPTSADWTDDSSHITYNPASTGVDQYWTEIIRLRELSFTKSKQGVGWMGKRFKIMQSNKFKGVESLLKTYSSGGTEQIVEAGAETMQFMINLKPLPAAAQGDLSPLDESYKESEVNFYYQLLDDNDNEIGDRMLLAKSTRDYVAMSQRTVWADDMDNPGDINSIVYTSMNIVPIASTYEIESGYPESTSYINAEWEHAAVVGRQVYIGAVTQPIAIESPNNLVSTDYSKILKAPIDKPAGFSDKAYIDIELGGSKITCMESSGDRLFVFTEANLIIINVAQDIEFIEATYKGYGVSTVKSVVKVGEGLAFVNKIGAFYFDGSKLVNISDEKYSTFDWDNVDTVSYEAPRKLLIFWNTSNGGLMYSLITQTWVNYFYKPLNEYLSLPKTQTVTGGTRPNLTYYYSNEVADNTVDDGLPITCLGDTGTGSDGIAVDKGSSVTINSNVNFRFNTGFINCGSPGRDKKFSKVRIRFKNARFLTMRYYLAGKNINNTNATTSNTMPGYEQGSSGITIAGQNNLGDKDWSYNSSNQTWSTAGNKEYTADDLSVGDMLLLGRDTNGAGASSYTKGNYYFVHTVVSLGSSSTSAEIKLSETPGGSIVAAGDSSSGNYRFIKPEIVNGEWEYKFSDANVGKTGKSIRFEFYDTWDSTGNHDWDDDELYKGRAPGGNMEIEDITIIYREKTVK